MSAEPAKPTAFVPLEDVEAGTDASFAIASQTATDAPADGAAHPRRVKLVGILFCSLSAVSYTLMNICMKQLAALQTDPTWATCNRELVTAVVLGPWLLWDVLRGRQLISSWRAIGAIALVGLAVQVLGNQSAQWAMGVVGLAINIPVIYGTMLVACAVLGWLVLREHVALRSLGAIALVLVALVLLGVGAAASAGTAAAQSTLPRLTIVLLAVLAGMLAGAVFALLSITIRRSVTGQTRGEVMMFVITAISAVSLAPISLWRLGPGVLPSTSAAQWGWMSAAGLANLLGFLFITLGLARTTVVHANVLSASQVAMAAVAGIVLFGEAVTPWLVLGVALTICGIVLVDHAGAPRKAPAPAERPGL